MKFLLFISLSLWLFAGEYYGKVEPIKEYQITSKVSGKVVFADDSLEGKIAQNQVVIKIDDEVAKINYQVAQATYEIKKDKYEKIKKLSTKSQTEKDNEKILFLNAKRDFLTSKDNFFSRTIRVNGLYIQDLKVKKGGFVNPGTPLIEAYDISKSKINIYVTREDLKDIFKKKIKVNGELGKYKVHKISKIADKVYVSSFKVELIGESVQRFSNIVKVEIEK